MSETTWNEDAIRRWARNELRAPADSDCYARANAILYALVSLRDARESAAHNAHENEHLRMTLGVYEPEALAWRRIAEALGMVQFADGHPPGYPEPHEVFAAVIALRDGAKVSALRANKLPSEYAELEAERAEVAVDLREIKSGVEFAAMTISGTASSDASARAVIALADLATRLERKGE